MKEITERLRKQKREWAKRNRRNENERHYRWRKNNPEKWLEHRRKWRIKHKGTVNEYNRRWRMKNLEKDIVRVANYRARRKKAEGYFSKKEWKKLKSFHKYICPSCGKKEPIIILTVDHIIPLIKGGSNYIKNIQPLCISCNDKKGTKIIKFKRKTEKIARTLN